KLRQAVFEVLLGDRITGIDRLRRESDRITQGDVSIALGDRLYGEALTAQDAPGNRNDFAPVVKDRTFIQKIYRDHSHVVLFRAYDDRDIFKVLRLHDSHLRRRLILHLISYTVDCCESM